VLPGDDVMLGEVTLAIHASASFSAGLEHHAQFMSLLGEELTRSRAFGHELVLIVVGATGKAGPLFEQWCRQIRQLLRPVDRIGVHSPGVVEILLPETTRAAGEQQGRRIADAVSALRCGVAGFPGPSGGAEELVEAALAALGRCDDAHPVTLTPQPSVPAAPVLPAESAPVLGGSAMRGVYDLVERVAPSDFPVLIYGETGSGKEVIARAIHDGGPRRQRQLHCVNCGAIPRDLVQSILFGHERGSFTGANQQSRGLFEQAHQSTLLLDEVGELPHEAQVALLRVLETRRINRIGGGADIAVDVRVISATHRDLEAMCEASTFRWDLFYRLNTIVLKVPPLRQRRDEIEALARHFVAQASERGGLPARSLSSNALRSIRAYQWPGNVRELRNAIERAMLVASGPMIAAGDLPDRVRVADDQTAQLRQPTPYLGEPAINGGETDPLADRESFKERVRAFEAMLIRRALRRTRWNKAAASRQLRIPLRTLVNKVGAYGLSPQDSVEEVAATDDDETLPFKSRVQRYETTLLREALEAAEGNRAEAARQLGLPLSTMLYKIKAYRLGDPA
jgi:DNA-binding NtrC family response regulator